MLYQHHRRTPTLPFSSTRNALDRIVIPLNVCATFPDLDDFSKRLRGGLHPFGNLGESEAAIEDHLAETQTGCMLCTVSLPAPSLRWKEAEELARSCVQYERMD